MNHELKCWPDPFDAIARGMKRFEFRKYDREFRVGDILTLREWMPSAEVYTNSGCIFATVTWIALGPAFGIPHGYCVMSIITERERYENKAHVLTRELAESLTASLKAAEARIRELEAK